MAEGLVQLYRSSVLCDLLTDTLEELVEEGKMSQNLGVKVLAGFDKSCLEALQRRAEAKAALSVCCCTIGLWLCHHWITGDDHTCLLMWRCA